MPGSTVAHVTSQQHLFCAEGVLHWNNTGCRELKDAYLQVCRDEAADPVSADRPYTEGAPALRDGRAPALALGGAFPKPRSPFSRATLLGLLG